MVKEALYKKAKLLTTVDKVSDVASLSAEEILKRIVQEAGGALKAVSTWTYLLPPYPVTCIRVLDIVIIMFGILL